MNSVSDFQEGLRSVRQRISQETLVVLLAVISIIAVYWNSLVVLLDDALRNEMASYILALPFLVAHMAYRNRKLLKAQLSHETEKTQNILLKDIVGAALCLSALFLYVYGSFTFNLLEYHLTSLIIFIVGCSAILLGIQNLKNMIFPLGFLLLLIVPYREETYQASTDLSILTSNITFNLLKLLGYPVTLSSLYDSPSIMVETAPGQQVPFVIDIPCAGAYSLIGFLVFALFFAYISHGSLLKKAMWLVLGFIFIYTINIARVSSVLAVAYWFGEETAMGLFHLLSGSFLIFLASLLMILAGEKTLKISLLSKQEAPEDTCILCEYNKRRNERFCNFCGKFFESSNITLSRADLGKILALSLLFAILTNVQVPTFALNPQNLMEMDIHQIAGSKETEGFLPAVDGYEPRFVYRDERFERVAQQDASLLYLYRSEEPSKSPIFVSVEIADSYSKLHRWEICLYVVPEEQGRQVVDPILSEDVSILENPPLIGRLFIFDYTRSRQTVMILYWYQKLAFKIENAWGNRYVKTSLIAYLDSFVRTGEIESVSQHADIESKMMSTAQSIVRFWEPVKEWSAYTVVFAQHGQTLAITAVAAALCLVAFFYLKEERERKDRANSIYKQLVWHSTFSEKEKQILKVLELLNEKREATGVELAKVYEEKTGENLNPEELTEMLGYAGDHNLVRRGIATREEKPVLTWRPTAVFNI